MKERIGRTRKKLKIVDGEIEYLSGQSEGGGSDHGESVDSVKRATSSAKGEMI